MLKIQNLRNLVAKILIITQVTKKFIRESLTPGIYLINEYNLSGQ